MKHQLFLTLFTLAAITPSGWAQQSRARTHEAAFLTAAPVKAAMDRLERRADTFEDRFEDALNKSSYNGTHTEDTLARWADMIEDEIDNMAEDYHENDHRQFTDHFENAMIAASAVNRTMLRKDFSAAAHTEWRGVREDLNHIATHLRRPVLPNVTVITIVAAAPDVLAKPDVRQTLDLIEASTDRFEAKFQKSIQHSTANMTPRERVWNQWVDYLEDVSDDMLEEYREKDARGFQEELERTLMSAEAMTRIMLRSDLFSDAEMEWKHVRDQLNVVARAFGYAPLTDLIHAR